MILSLRNGNAVRVTESGTIEYRDNGRTFRVKMPSRDAALALVESVASRHTRDLRYGRVTQGRRPCVSST